MRSFLAILLFSAASAADCDDFHAVKCTQQFVDNGCDFSKGAPTNLGWGCQPYADCSIKACGVGDYAPYTNVPIPADWTPEVRVQAVGTTVIDKSRSSTCAMFVIGEDVAISPSLDFGFEDVMLGLLPAKEKEAATIEVTYTKQTVFDLMVKGQDFVPQGGTSKNAKKFLKDLEDTACPGEDKADTFVRTGNLVVNTSPIKKCTVEFSNVVVDNEFGAATYTVQVVQPVEPDKGVADIAALTKNQARFELMFASSKIGYAFPIKMIATPVVQVAADVCVKITEILPEGVKTESGDVVQPILQAADLLSAAASYTGLSSQRMQVYVDDKTEVETKQISCPESCFEGLRRLTAKKDKPKKKLLFGAMPFCHPFCKVVSGYLNATRAPRPSPTPTPTPISVPWNEGTQSQQFNANNVLPSPSPVAPPRTPTPTPALQSSDVLSWTPMPTPTPVVAPTPVDISAVGSPAPNSFSVYPAPGTSG